VASIKDVARLAGVSISTVSRVVRDSPLVDAGTRARVEAAIAKVDYRPNLLAQGLRSRKGGVIGLVVPEIIDEVFSTFIHHVERCCVERGFDLMVGNTAGHPETEGAFIEKLLRRQVDGIIFSRFSDRSQVMSRIQRRNVPVVVIDRAHDREDLAAVVLDNYRAGTMAAEHLIGLGHRRLGEVTGPRDITLARERHRGYAAAIRRHGLTLAPRHVLEGDFEFESGQRAAQALLRRSRPEVTAVWCQADPMAVGVWSVLLKEGLRVPQDVSVMGMDDNVISQMTVPPLTTITQPFEEMCRRAVELVVAMRGGERTQRPWVVLRPGIAVRESTAPPPPGVDTSSSPRRPASGRRRGTGRSRR
jgi:DNA-binding LacI/PurR family transcriptional regulator